MATMTFILEDVNKMYNSGLILQTLECIHSHLNDDISASDTIQLQQIENECNEIISVYNFIKSDLSIGFKIECTRGESGCRNIVVRDIICANIPELMITLKNADNFKNWVPWVKTSDFVQKIDNYSSVFAVSLQIPEIMQYINFDYSIVARWKVCDFRKRDNTIAFYIKNIADDELTSLQTPLSDTKCTKLVFEPIMITIRLPCNEIDPIVYTLFLQSPGVYNVVPDVIFKYIVGKVVKHSVQKWADVANSISIHDGVDFDTDTEHTEWLVRELVYIQNTDKILKQPFYS